MRSPAELRLKIHENNLVAEKALVSCSRQDQVHAGDVGGYRTQLDALAVERPWPVDHVGENRDAHPGATMPRTASTEEVRMIVRGRRPVGFQ